MAQAAIKIKDEDLRSTRLLLLGIKNGAPKVITRALNKTLTGARTDLVKQSRELVNLSAKVIRDACVMNRANWQNLKASLQAKTDSIPLINYSARQVKSGVSVNVLKSTPRVLVRHAFISTMKSGHKGVFWRSNIPNTISGVTTGKPRPEFGRLKGKADQYRLPIKQLFGPSLEAIWEERPAAMDKLQLLTGERLNSNMEHELDYYLERLK